MATWFCEQLSMLMEEAKQLEAENQSMRNDSPRRLMYHGTSGTSSLMAQDKQMSPRSPSGTGRRKASWFQSCSLDMVNIVSCGSTLCYLQSPFFRCMKVCTVALYIPQLLSTSAVVKVTAASLGVVLLFLALLLNLRQIPFPSEGLFHELVVCAGVVAFFELLLIKMQCISRAGKDEACFCFAVGTDHVLLPIQKLKCSGTLAAKVSSGRHWLDRKFSLRPTI